MTPERWKQIEDVMLAALRCPPGERATLLDEACGDDASLRMEVESLLASEQGAQKFLELNALHDISVIKLTGSNSLGDDRIGAYSLETQIGSGGMGEVYLARDVRLGRKVALKLLDPNLIGDSISRTRFLQEARLASALDHPNICTIHEVGEASGRLFIAMQYVEGDGLRRLIRGRPLSLKSLLSISLQVADALVAAHLRGIIHRDIKAGNIIITPQGLAKVLDFGIAKLLEEAGGENLDLTKTGVVMGTPSSMSPEQARGEHVDHRTDIFSFGVVLYEMATGRLPFPGKSRAEVINALVNQTHQPAVELNRELPPRLSGVIDRALEKNPANRFQSMPEMIAELRGVVREAGGLDDFLDSSGVVRGVAPLIPPRRRASFEVLGRRIPKRVVAGLAAAVVSAAALALAIYQLWPNQTNGRSPGMSIRRLTTVGTATAATVSPDGKYIVFATGEAMPTGGVQSILWPAGRSSLWVKQISTDRVVEIVPPADMQFRGTTFSFDGELVYYVGIDRDNPLGALYRVPVLGGPSRKVLTHIACPIAFSPDGKQFAFIRNYPNEGADKLVVVSVDGNAERTLAVRKGNDWFEEDGLAWSPDGKTIACVVGTDTGGTSMTVVEVPVAGGEPKPIISHKWGIDIGRIAWLADRSGVIAIAREREAISSSGTDTQVWHIAYPGGAVHRITNDLSGYSHTSLGLTSDSRSLVTVQEDTSVRIWTATLDGSKVVTEAATQITAGKFDGRYGLSWTPDGHVVYVTRVGEDEDVWIMNEDGTGQRQLTDDAAFDETPVVSPDGSHIYFVSTRSGIRHIWRMNVDGSDPRQLTEGASIDYEPSCSPDGKWVAFSSWRSGTLALWKVPAEGGEPVRLTNNPAARAVFSPDGKFISCAYFDEQAPSAGWRVAIIPSQGGPPVKILDLPYQTINALAGLWWTPDSRALVYIDTPSGVSNVWSLPLDGGPAKQLTNFSSNQMFNLALTRDGRRLAIARGGVIGDVVLIRDFR